MSYGRKYQSIIALGAFLFVVSGVSATPAENWRAECVGRFLVSVPGDIEIALVSPLALTKTDMVDKYRFKNNETAPHSDVHYQGVIEVTPEQHGTDFRALRLDVSAKKEHARQYFFEEGDANTAKSIKPFPIEAMDTFAWRSKQTIDAYLFRTNRIYHYFVSGLEEENEHELFLGQFFTTFHPRPIFTLPKGEGVCIPYGFIADDGKPGRDIGVTMRLKDHPEVEIFFEDQTAPQPYTEGAHLADSLHLNMFFLEEQVHGTNGVKVPLPGYRSVTLGGYPGTASFFEIKRKDGTLDYGYVATVAGDYTAKGDTPRLMLYVIRTASRAKGTPISKSELKDMAYKIAASIKRRDVR